MFVNPGILQGKIFERRRSVLPAKAFLLAQAAYLRPMFVETAKSGFRDYMSVVPSAHTVEHLEVVHPLGLFLLRAICST